jgi:hypothetical protein
MATNAKKLTYWQQHFKRCQASGLTRRAYCAREGLALSTFDRWRSLSRSSGGAPSKAALTLVPIQVERPLHVTLKSPAGWEIQLPATLRELTDFLKQLP